MSTGSSETECPKCGGQADSLYDNSTRTEEIWCRTCGHFVNGTLLPEDDQNPGGVDGPFSVRR